MKKRFYFITAATLSLVACSRNQEVDVPDANLSLFARTESPADTKTVVESGVHVYWEPGDEIAVFTGEQSAKFSTDITASSATATFKGTFGDATWPEDLDLWAVYPFSENAVFDGETITTTLPSEQVAREGSFGKDMNLAIAHSNSSTLQFYNVGGGIRFSVTEEGIKRVVLSSLGEENLSGQIHLSFQNGIPTYKEGIGVSPYIALSATDNGFVPGEWYFINALPQNLPNGFQLRFYKDGSSGVRVFEKSVEIKRGIFGTVANADTGVEFYQDEMVQVDDDAIEGLINQCIDSEVDVETKREELEALPSVESVEILEMETIVHFVSGEVVYYPYAFPSIFDQEDIAGAAPAPKKTKSKEKAPAKASGYVAADVAIFNLFSEDRGRKNQNKLVENTKAVFERAGKSVHIYGRDDFNIDNLVEAIKSNAIIFVSTLGTTDNRILLGQKKTNIPETYDNLMYINNFHTKKYDWSQRYTTDIIQILNDKHYSGPLVYLASCYTKPNNNSSLNLVGWNGINKVGQAYGLIIADYYATWGKTYQAFSIDFSNDHTPSGTIIDPLETNTKLIHYGYGWSGNSRDGWTELKYDNKVVIDQPTPGTCNKNLKYAVKLSYRNTGSLVTDGKSVTYDNGNKYYLEYTNLGDDENGILRRSDPLRFKDDKVEYNVKNLTPGVWRFLSYPTSDDLYYGALKYQDCTYAIFSHSFKENDVQEDETPVVVTLGTLAGTEDLVLGGGVINRSLAGLETGFQYWKKDSPTNKWIVATTTTYEDYFGAVLQIPDLDGEYEFRAFAKDEEGLIGYGDIQSFKYSGGPQQEYAVPEIVDLGLPSGVKWASFNLGATKPEEYGDYFAWGEIEPYYESGYAQSQSPVWRLGKEAGYDWPSYKWSNGSEQSLTNYCYDYSYGHNGYMDEKTILDPEDDAAHANLGDKWRMPTNADLNELRELCRWESTTLNGVHGLKVTGLNGNSIFLPNGGSRDKLYIKNISTTSDYWTSSLYSESSLHSVPSYAYSFGCYDGDVAWGGSLRIFGYAIRPVYGEAKTTADYATPEMVDLGLSVKWASFNLGATKPEEHGDLFAWGETEPYYSSLDPLIWKPGKGAGYSPLSYKWCVDSSEDEFTNITKYCTDPSLGYNGFTDRKTVLELEDDAAHVNLGGYWRMPTWEEWKELINECKWEGPYYLDGDDFIEGWRITGPNGNSIFLPPVSDCYSADDNSDSGTYWSSSLYNYNGQYSSDVAHILIFHTTGTYDGQPMNDCGNWRYEGHSIRPVYDDK